MNQKIESDDLQKQTTYDMQAISGSRNWVIGEYGQRRIKKKRNPIGARLYTDHGKVSTYSSSSKLTSFFKGQSMSEADNFKSSESALLNQLAQKYVPRGSPPEKVKQQMQLVLQRKKSQIQALRVHRDELKFISYNNPYDNPIKMSLAVLKDKARTQQKIKDMVNLLQKDIKEIEFQFNTMTDYYNFISNALKSNDDEDLIIDTHQEEKLMVDNLEKETNHLFKELKEQDKKNAKQIKGLQQEIAMLRVNIKQKQDKIRDLKSMICTLHIKLHSRGSTTKQKSMSISIRKFITEQNSSIQQAFIGNNSFKHYSKELLEKISGEQQIIKIMFYYEPKKEHITFRCGYKCGEGKLHSLENSEGFTNTVNTIPIANKQKKQVASFQTQIKLKYLLSMKFFFKSKIVGIECRMKSQKGTEHIQIGNCSPNLEHQLLTLINKKLITLGSYWHHKDMIGVGVWYCNKIGLSSRNTSTDSKDTRKVRNTKPIGNKRREDPNQEYYIQ